MYDYDDDDVGLPRSGVRAARRAARGARRAGRKSPRGGVGDRRLVLGLGSVEVPAGGTAELTTTVQRPVQGDRLVLVSSDDTGAVLLIVEDVLVGVRSQYNSTTGAPIQAFKPEQVRGEFHMDPAGTGVDVTIRFSNPDAAAITVAGALYGSAFS